jgi:hypothetical protein
MKAFTFRSAVKSVRYEVFETIINMISPIYRHIEESKCTFGLFVCVGNEFIVFILDVHRYSKLCAFSTF